MKKIWSFLKTREARQETRELGPSYGSLETWLLEAQDADLADRFVYQQHIAAFEAGGLLLKTNLRVPTLTVDDLADTRKVEASRSRKSSYDILFVPVRPASANGVFDLVLKVSEVDLDVGGATDDVCRFFVRLADCCTAIPYFVDASTVVATLHAISDSTGLRLLLENDFIELLSRTSRLENRAPATVVAETLRTGILVL